MVFYKNIEVGHPYKKIWSIVPEVLETKPEVIVVAGAQYREEVKTLVEGSILYNYQIILVEFREEEAKKWKEEYENLPNIVILQEDFDQVEKYIIPLMKGKKVLIYDNLCGGSRRFDFWKKWSAMDNIEVLAYLTNRGGTLNKLKELGLKFSIKSQLDSLNYIIKLSKQGLRFSIKKVDQIPPRRSSKNPLRCSFCGQPAYSSYTYIDKNGILHCGYCGTKKPPIISSKTYDTLYSQEKRGLKCPKCNAFSGSISIRKKGKRYKCCKCKHEWSIEERLDYEERKEEFLNHPIMKKYLQINKQE